MDIYKFLSDHRIEYERHDHSPVFTVEDVNRLVPPLPAAKTKSLFLSNKKGSIYFMVISKDNVKIFLDKTGHDAKILDVPGL